VSSYYLHVDESIRGNVIAVGGYICAASDLDTVTRSWIEVREQLGLDEEQSLKWNYGKSSAVRRSLEERGWDRRERRPIVLEAIREAPITLLADVIYDDRGLRRTPIDFYTDALDWLLLRFRNFLTDMSPTPPGPHVVVLDQPSPAPPARWLENRETLWYHRYRRAWLDGWSFSFRGNRVRPMRKDGFFPSVVISHAKFNPLLEIADAVAGLTMDFAHHNLQEEGMPEEVSWEDDQLIRVARKFRSDSTGNILNHGFGLFPRTAPAFEDLRKWVTVLSTSPNYASLRS